MYQSGYNLGEYFVHLEQTSNKQTYLSLNNYFISINNNIIMDDFNVSSLHESKNEWGARLLTIITPHIVEGLHSIFDEAFKLCKDNNELDKYLMTFQNFITRIPKWNSSIIENERKRIVEKSGCGYLLLCVQAVNKRR